MTADVLHSIISLVSQVFFYHPISAERAINKVMKGKFGKIVPKTKKYIFLHHESTCLITFAPVDG